jgi:RNA polymerase sigma-70 factor (ECF subfamily)
MDVIKDEHLAMRAMQGDGDAFGMLYERYVHAIFRYVMIRVGHREEAEDLVTAIFLRAWHALGRFRARKGSFRTWLYSIASHALIDHYRCSKPECGLDEADPFRARGREPEDCLAAKEERAHLLSALGKLQPDYQEVIALRFADGLSHAEAAEIMGRSDGAVRVLQHRALIALRQAVTAQGGDHDR